MSCCRWGAEEEMKSVVEQTRDRDSVEVTPCVVRASVILVAWVGECRVMSWASDLVVPSMMSLEKRESSGT